MHKSNLLKIGGGKVGMANPYQNTKFPIKYRTDTILYDRLVNEVASHDICMIYHADMLSLIHI